MLLQSETLLSAAQASLCLKLTENYQKSSRTPYNVAAVRDSVISSPSKSVFGINRESMRRILIRDLNMYPYRIQIKQKLTPDDMRKQVIICQWFCDKIDAVPNFLCKCLVFRQSTFSVVRSHKLFFWGSTPPEHCPQRPLHSVKCTAWVAISKHGIIGLFWFNDDNEQFVTINIEQYVQVLGKFWTALGQRRGCQDPPMLPAECCHPPHLKQIIGMATAAFPDQLIMQWLLHSPDLNPPDFYLWGYFKDRVYGNNTQTIPELKVAITAAIRAISWKECRRVIKNFACWIQMCLQCQGAHFGEHFWSASETKSFCNADLNFGDVCYTGLT